MTPEDPLVRHYVATSLVMRLATLSAAGHASVTPLWFVTWRGALVAATGAATIAARNVRADPRVSVLLDGERAGRSRWLLRLAGVATAHPGMPPMTAVARLATKYSLSPRGARDEIAHARLWRLRLAYSGQSDAVWLEIRPTGAELLPVPQVSTSR
jgi:hypothetical protein